MANEFVSVFVVVLCAFVCPVLAALTPNRVVPETVFLLVAGMVLGPNVLGVVHADVAIGLLSDLGLGFLFLLAGYEIDTRELKGEGGRHGLLTWLATFAFALAIAIPVGLWRGNAPGGLAIAIMLTTTAFGTLIPILKERGLENTAVGKGVVEYGIWGELCPVIAMAVLLGTRAKWITVLLLALFAAAAVASVFVSKWLNRKGSPLARFVKKNSETNSQTSVRFVMVLLVGLVALSALFNLDIVLGAFAAGFALRAIIPKGDSSLEHKLNGIAYGFLVPLFFVASGMKIDPLGVVAEPLLLATFMAGLLLVRAIPIFVSTSRRKDMQGTDPRVRASIALYCTTALPLIVAVTSVAMSSGALSASTGSALVAAGGLSVLVMPLLASVALHAIDADLPSAAHKIAQNPRHAIGILKQHHRMEREKRASSRHVLTKPESGERPPQ